MRYQIVFVAFVCLVTCGCQQSMNAELASARAELAEANAKLAASQSSHHGKRLVHVVWFKMKDGATNDDYDALIGELNKLVKIEVVSDLEVGRFQDLGDSRAMSDLDVVMQMGFDSEADYRTYQTHPIHVQLKSDIGDFLGGPPVTYDYWSE